MMIKNLTPRLMERGKIKIGKKGAVRNEGKPNEYQLPMKLDHFVVTTLDKDETNNFTPDPKAIELYGDKPRSLPIRLLYNDGHMNFMSRYASYVGKSLWCSGDGKTALQTNGGNGKVQVVCPCERIAQDYDGKDKCKFNGNLSVILDGMPGVGGVWSFRTTSYNSVVNIMSSLAQIQLITGGPIAGIPLNLVLRPKVVEAPGGKTQTVYVVGIEYAGTMDQLAELGMDKLKSQIEHRIEVRKLELEANKLLLPAPTSGVFDGDDEDDVGAEFYPEATDFDPETGEVKDTKPEEPKHGDPALAGLVQTTAKKPVDIDIPSDLDRRNSSATDAKVQHEAHAGTDDLQDELGDGGDHVNSSAPRAASDEATPTGEQNTVSKQADTPPGADAGSGQSAGAGNSPQEAAGSPPVSVPLIDDPDAKMIRLINPGNKSVEQEWTRTNTNVDHWCSALQEILWENQGAPAVFAAWWNLHKDAAHAFQGVLSKKPEHKTAYSNMGGLIEFAEGTMGDHEKQGELV